MASQESIAIREEKAIGQIQAAVERLKVELGVELPVFSLTEKRIHPAERNVTALEKVVEILCVMSPEPEPVVEPEPEEVKTDDQEKQDEQPKSEGEQPDGEEAQEQGTQAPEVGEVVTPFVQPEPLPLPQQEQDTQALERLEGESEDGDDHSNTSSGQAALITKDSLRGSKANGNRRK